MRRLTGPCAGILVALAAATLGGCTGFAYVSRNYAALTPQVVTIGCNEPYEIYDNRRERRLLVVSNALREVAGCDLGAAATDPDPARSRPTRFRTAARTYLDETVREACRISGEIVFDALKSEFTYACAGPVEARGTKVPRLPGRGPVNPGSR